MSLDGAITYLNTLLSGMTDVNAALEDPTESVSAFPAVMVYPQNGTFVGLPGNRFRGLHTIHAEVHFNRSNLPTAYSRMRPMVKRVADKLRADPTLGGAVDTIISTEGQPVTYQVVNINYADVEATVLRFRVTVKVYEQG